MKACIHSIVVLFISLMSILSLTAQVVQINQTFTSDTIITPFTGSTPVYSLSLNGKITLNSDSSLVRVVLVDTSGNHYMVFESYPLITMDISFDTLNASDETTYLDGAVCDSLRIDIINALFDLDSLKLDTDYISNASSLQIQAKWDHDSVKINIMNQRIEEEHMYWRAGRTSRVNIFSNEKESIYGRSYNLLGWEYYKGGIFERINHRVQKGTYNSQYVSEFDWRNRHGANIPNTPYFDGENTPTDITGTGWITPIKDQNWPKCGACYIFSAVGAVEARKNLYYNTHNPNSYTHNDIDISEQDIQSCDIVNCGNNSFTCNGGWPNQVLNYMRDYTYTVDEECFPYETNPANSPDNVPCSSPPKCTDPDFGVKITNQVTFPMPIMNPDELKHALITEGPIAGSVNSIMHAMTLVGYSSAYPDQIVYKGTGSDDPDIILDEYCNFYGETWWIYKESQGQSEAWWYFTNDFSEIASAVHCYLIGPLIFDNYEPDAQCSDEDDDGYCWWGVGHNAQPSYCEECLDQCDCDDNNPNVGQYNLDPLKGLLYECTPLCDFQVNKYEEVREENGVTPAWDTPRHFNRNVIIRSGAHLTISAKIKFSPLAKLVIEPGASVTLKNQGILTTASNYCTGLWRGVELWGYTNQPPTQQYQGKIIIENGGIIENAWFGIRNFNPGYNPDGSGSYPPVEEGYPTGGIIQADGAIFRNNKTAVKFYPYREDNASYFKNCTFVTDDELEGSQIPDCFIRMDGITGVEIKKCSFQNSLPKNQSPFGSRGKGIFCLNSDIAISHTQSTDSTYFKSLDYGIHALNGATFPNLFISQCSFHNNRKGISTSGYPEERIDIQYNTFWLNDVTKAPDDSLFMIFLDQCSGFKVWYNKLIVNSSIYNSYPNMETYGIVVNNSGGATSFIYNNGVVTDAGYPEPCHIHHFKVALQGRNTNRFEDISGLCFKCNDMMNNTFDIISYSDDPLNDDQGISVYQGKQFNPGGNNVPERDPAGNTFSPDHSNQDPYGHINNEVYTNPYSTINYIYHYYGPPNRIPTEISTQVFPFIYDNDESIYSKPNSCLQTIYPEGSMEELRNSMLDSETKIDSLTLLLAELIDDGSTDTLHTEVENSYPSQSYEVYQDLITPSPYLSDSVLIKAIEKEDVLPNAMIRDILVANPQSAKNDSLLTTLDNRVNPMPDSLYAQILEGTEFLGAKELLENELAEWKRKRQLYFNSLILLFISDTVNAWAEDSLIALFENDPELSSKYTLTLYYIQNREFVQANNILQDIPITFTMSPKETAIHQKYMTLLPILQQIYIDSLGFVLPDSNQVNSLFTLAADDSDLPGTYARNLLISFDLLNYEEPYIINPTLKSSRKIRNYSKSNLTSHMKVFPNPCSDYTTIEYKIPGTLEIILLTIFNSNGKPVLLRQLHNIYDQVILPVKDLKPGIYMAEIKSGGKRIASVKLLVIR